MKNLSDVQIRLSIVREWLFVALLAGAPFSFNPSISTPTFGFVSFRVGVYQSLIVLFVFFMIPVLWQKRLEVAKDPLFLLCSTILVVLAVMSPFRSFDISRSALMSSSFVLLLLLLASGWAFAKTQLIKDTQHTLFRAIVIVGCAVAGYSLLQFTYNTFKDGSLGLCANCGAGIFGFPRINGLAAEPQFYANSLMPPILLVYGYLMRQKNGIRSFVLFGFLIFAFVLTLSRGAYVALLFSLIVFNLSLITYKKMRWEQLGKSGLIAITATMLAICSMTASATIRHKKTNPNIAQETIATIAEHLSGGVIELPYNDPKPVAEKQSQPQFQSPGVIEASHEDRESAASVGLKLWRGDKYIMSLGLGVGNLGSSAHNHDQSIPVNLTIYIQYIFMLVEIGIAGLASFLTICILAFIRATRLIKSATSTFSFVLSAIIAGFMAHYIFFGTYINVPYVWLYTGIGLGLVAKSVSQAKKVRHSTK